MIAFFGLGTQELLLLVLMALGIGVVVAIVVLSSRASGSRSSNQAALEEENRRLREELDRAKNRQN